MLLISQCIAFQPWSQTFARSWIKGGYMRKACDLVETQDLLEWQKLTTKVPVTAMNTSWRGARKTPDVVSTGIPLSTIVSAHHNLVTYGVPFETWTNPLPKDENGEYIGNIGLKRYYGPKDAIEQLAGSPLFEQDAEVKAWLAKNPELEPASVYRVPGMSHWVEKANKCFAKMGSSEGCAKWLGKDNNFWEMWADVHQQNPESGDEDA